MTTSLIVGLDGTPGGDSAIAYAKRVASLVGAETRIILCYVVEWSPYSFNTPEENAQRASRRENEIKLAHERVLTPAISELEKEGYQVEGRVRHGDAAEILSLLAREVNAEQIIVGRKGESVRSRIFGSVTAHLIQEASVPVTIVP
ncbi:universal stress protein [Cobetia sp. LC6]|uniref:universal stress protein n=1 Tax=Cobetia sp. LC6 TaxID=3050947 RepID=UPI002554E155|nr:universal stress protein [Cobetia sp. LC6]MDL2192969.1 universal stress protein [Cobetia sp. LC6]